LSERRHAGVAGFRPEGFAGHSLRTGFLASGAEAAGASVLAIAGLIDRWAEDGRLPDHLRLVPKLGGM
jgi:hypothetical protein